MPFTDSGLERMIKDGESAWVEFRAQLSNKDDNKKISETICAFANALANGARPGVVFIGINDNGSPSNVPVNDSLLTKLSSLVRNGDILPPPSILVENRSLLGHDVAVVTVNPANSPPVTRRLAFAQKAKTCSDMVVKNTSPSICGQG